MSRWPGWTYGDHKVWQKITCPQVLARDNWECQIKYPGTWMVPRKAADGTRTWEERQCLKVATQVHHTIGKHTKNDQRYLVAACQPCNGHIGDPSKRRVLGEDADWF